METHLLWKNHANPAEEVTATKGTRGNPHHWSKGVTHQLIREWHMDQGAHLGFQNQPCTRKGSESPQGSHLEEGHPEWGA
jgi:hypothetical protein